MRNPNSALEAEPKFVKLWWNWLWIFGAAGTIRRIRCGLRIEPELWSA